MPIKSGKSKKIQDQNFREAWASYKRTGKFGNTTPKNDAHARRIITAAVKGKARESGAKIPKGKGKGKK